jgi:Zn-dependent protease
MEPAEDHRREPDPHELRDYDPLHPSGFDWRGFFRRIWAPIAAVAAVAIKFGFVFIKFFGIFISVGGYALIWGWKFAIGFVALILVHELGHFFEARRQGLEVSLPTFIPFFGAFVLIKNSPLNPWRNSLVALAGPAAGGIGSAICWAIGEHSNSDLMRSLAYAGFLLNLFNLLPIGIFDGGAVWRAIRLARHVPEWTPEVAIAAPYSTIPGGGRGKAFEIALLYGGLVTLLVIGMVVTHVPQHRL